MVALLRNNQRLRVQCRKQEMWRTFFAQAPLGPLAGGFGDLVAFDELRLPPGDSTEPYGDEELELVTYVFKGRLAQEDTAGNSGVIQAGEFQCMSTRGRIGLRDMSASRSEWVHIFRISLRPPEGGGEPEHEQKRFTAAQRRNQLCVVASPDGRQGSLRIRQDALVFSAMLDPGHHLVHELASGRSAWLHMVCGEATLHDVVVSQGDGLGVTNELAVSFTVQEPTEVLLVDLGPASSAPWEKADQQEIPTDESRDGPTTEAHPPERSETALAGPALGIGEGENDADPSRKRYRKPRI